MLAVVFTTDGGVLHSLNAAIFHVRSDFANWVIEFATTGPTPNIILGIEVTYCLSIFIPTLIILGAIIVFSLAYLFISLCRASGLYVLEKSTEDQKNTIFTVTGVFVGLLVLISKIATTIVAQLSG